ncbi:MAG: HIT family protein [Mycoplasma sp.]|nr:HIT family protein [Mycoplasma sp.]
MNKDVFSKIIDRELPANIIYEDDKVIAILDAYPVTEGHFLVIPKKYSTNLFDVGDEELVYAIKKARELAVQRCKDNKSLHFKLLINSGEKAEQTVMRTHIHIIPYV